LDPIHLMAVNRYIFSLNVNEQLIYYSKNKVKLEKTVCFQA